MWFMRIAPRSTSINKSFKLSRYICPIRWRHRNNNISPFILFYYSINIIFLNAFCCSMTFSTSFAKFYIIIINTYVFNIMFLFQTSSNYITAVAPFLTGLQFITNTFILTSVFMYHILYDITGSPHHQ